jgi:hypothetical protein
MNPGNLVTAFVVSTIGGGFLAYGKKQSRAPQIAGGLLLLCAPYFVGSVAWIIAIAALIVAGMWIAVRAGW